MCVPNIVFWLVRRSRTDTHQPTCIRATHLPSSRGFLIFEFINDYILIFSLEFNNDNFFFYSPVDLPEPLPESSLFTARMINSLPWGKKLLWTEDSLEYWTSILLFLEVSYLEEPCNGLTRIRLLISWNP